jgi:tripartite ATP-independent transporter DctP family solute receptor
MIADEINAMDVGLQIDVFSNSSLGPDAERVSSLIAGDIDLDLQGPSAISAAYEPIGVLDSAYAFTGADHLFEFFDSGAADQLQDGLLEATGLRTIQPYFFGMRNFSANSAIRTPEDLEGLRMRFPDTPAYLANAQALGAEAVPVAFEELFLALQQGIVDGQENPIPTVKSMSLDEVQSHVSLSEHHTGVQLLVVNEDRWQSLSSEQQDALNSVIATNRDVNRACIDEEQQEIVEEWEETGAVELVTDVDRAAFAAKAEAFWLDRYTGDELAIYEAIRSSAPE